MKKRTLILTLLLLVSILIGAYYQMKLHRVWIFAKHEKKVEFRKIGNANWFTEYTWNKAFKKAKQEKKLVFVDFSAMWCGPCQWLKKKVFSGKDFDKVVELAVPVYIEQTTKTGKKLCDKYNIKAFPTVKIFNGDGKELASVEGARLDINFYYNLVSLYSLGITKENILSMIEEGKVNLKQVLYFSDVYGVEEYGEKANVLAQAIEKCEGEYSLLTEVCEELIITLSEYKKRNSLKEDDLKPWFEKLQKLLKKLNKKDRDILNLEIECTLKECKPEMSLVKSVLKENDLRHILSDFQRGFYSVLNALVISKNYEKANRLIDDALEISEGKDINRDLKIGMLTSILQSIVKVCLNPDKIDNSEVEKLGNYIALLYDKYKNTSLFKEIPFVYFMMEFNKNTGKLSEQLVSFWEDFLKKGKIDKVSAYRQIVLTYINAGDFEKAEKVIKEKIDKQENFKKYGSKKTALLLNNLVWRFVEKHYYDNYLFSIMDKVIKEDKKPEYMDTLANLYALKGDYKKALELEKSAVEILKKQKVPERKIQPYIELIKKCERRISKK